MDNESATAIKAGAEAVGADNKRCGALSGRAERSEYVKDILYNLQVINDGIALTVDW